MALARGSLGAISSLVETDLQQLEIASANFISQELAKSGILNRIEIDNGKVSQLLEEINFYGDWSSYLTGVFSHGFSADDESR
jgi:hypothetical protein